MVKEGIVLWHKISRAGIEVDKAKTKAISKLPHPTNVKSIRSFLGHAGFYHCFIKDFSKITRPMTQLLMKDAKFDFSNECVEAFETQKKELTKAPIMVKPDWSLPFKLIKIMTEAQENYTTTEKELLAVVFAFDKFRQYLVLSKTVVYTDHFALRYLFSKQDAKPCAENLAANHLSRLENHETEDLNEAKIDDRFPDESIMKMDFGLEEPWFADFSNYLVVKELPYGMTIQEKKKFFSDLKYYFWDDPHLFKVCDSSPNTYIRI
ncbi:reverse transcriptase domain-containing protein [Tanacetum coccineum]|uniref:Reverse transcriptase domain-containing protein n=1 Tax=Tanacetum coccineum TaxID=301880 RepID=A0ABQ5CUR9_9ASTR